MKLRIAFRECLAGGLFFLAILPVQAVGPELPESPPEFKKLLSQFLERRGDEVCQPISKKAARLDQNYDVALQREIERATARGELNAVLELREERKRIEDGNPCDLSHKFRTDGARKLADVYQREIRKLVAFSRDLEAEFAEQLGGALDDLKSELTRQGRIEDALAVKGFREGSAFEAFVTGYRDVVAGVPFGAVPAEAAEPEESAVGVGIKINTPAEFKKWLQEQTFEFSGKIAGRTILHFYGNYLSYASGTGHALYFPFDVVTPRSIDIDSGRFRIEISKDLLSGTFESSSGNYELRVLTNEKCEDGETGNGVPGKNN